ncbi:Increased DNA methylation 3-like protein [Drosera capensis]
MDDFLDPAYWLDNFVNDGKQESCKEETEPMPADDSLFILYLIMGTYFGPDIKDERPRKSILQRKAEGLPLYTADQLEGSSIRTSEVEETYYKLLQEADAAVKVKVSTLRKFIEGSLTIDGIDDICPQFADLFLLDLHPHSVSRRKFRLIGNVVPIDEPETAFLGQDVIEKFKRLTGLHEFPRVVNSAKLENSVVLRGPDTMEGGFGTDSLDDYLSLQKKRGQSFDGLEAKHNLSDGQGSIPETAGLRDWWQELQILGAIPSDADSGSKAIDGPAMVFLPPQTTTEELDGAIACTEGAFALAGNATKGQVGPVIGLMDIAESEESYLFRVALPGVKREDGAFRCEVESDGKVLIIGETTTGEKTVYRYTQAFEMLTRNLCPPGPFTISFRLPGPVDPLKFSGSFGTDGIMEGLVIKPGCPTTNS